ncbi:MAG: tripartite tricarboxylate transporter substrate binding protein [Betaproteobacteria bacterium]|nr:tripartite tricarboxylate transporter substrate binding protein [Betaproteobacteria bacterium]
MRLACLLVSLFAACCGAPVHAQDYPSRAVRIIVTFPAGGSADITARMFGEKLAEQWKQAVIVENRTGAGGSIGVEAAYRAAPDGYTLLLMSNTHIINHVLFRKLPFDITGDFPALGVVTASPMLIAVHPSVPAGNMKELAAMLKASPGKFDYASCNMASPHHFAMEMIKHALAIDAVHIPHRGCGPASADAAAGHVRIVATNAPTALQFVKDGRLRAIALLSTARSPSLPEVPTVRESGIPELKNLSLDNYYGFMAPPATPAAITAKLEADIRRAAALPELRQRLDGAGFDMFVLSSGEMMKLVRADAEKYAQAAKQAAIKLE